MSHTKTHFVMNYIYAIYSFLSHNWKKLSIFSHNWKNFQLKKKSIEVSWIYKSRKSQPATFIWFYPATFDPKVAYWIFLIFDLRKSKVAYWKICLRHSKSQVAYSKKRLRLRYRKSHVAYCRKLRVESRKSHLANADLWWFMPHELLLNNWIISIL